MNLHEFDIDNQEIVENLLHTFGIEKTQLFCQIQAHLFKQENKAAFDSGFYQHLWWSRKAEELLSINKKPPKL